MDAAYKARKARNAKRWRDKNRAAVRLYDYTRYHANHTEARASRARYYAANREKILAALRAKTAAKREIMNGYNELNGICHDDCEVVPLSDAMALCRVLNLSINEAAPLFGDEVATELRKVEPPTWMKQRIF